jgi:23S rRNA pseudouridine2605 synthase
MRNFSKNANGRRDGSVHGKREGKNFHGKSSYSHSKRNFRDDSSDDSKFRERPEKRPERRFDGEHSSDDRRFSDRPKRRFDGEHSSDDRRFSDRPKRRFDGEHSSDDRRFSDRPERRPKRRFDGEHSSDDRRFSDRPKRRPERRFDSDRPASDDRRFSDRPKRRFDGEHSSDDRRFSDRPERRPKRRPKRRFDDDRPVRNPKPKAEEYVPKPRGAKAEEDGSIRLNKFIANSGVCSRREADDYIVAGLITVNGQVITELGTKIQVTDDVRFNGERLHGEEKVYILMNKPKDFVTTVTDPNADRTVLDLVAGKCPQRVYPVGRLDKATTGVLLLTNDGELSDKLTHPSNRVRKIYHVFLDKNLSQSDFNKILEGVELEDGPMFADALSFIDEDESQVGLEIHSGRNRVVRRMFEALGYKVKKLDRVLFAGLTKKGLRRGQWRFLTEQEISLLKMGQFE